MAATSAAATPIFSDAPIEYIGVVLESTDHLFLFDRDLTRFSGLLTPFFIAQETLGNGQTTILNLPRESVNVVTRAMDNVLDFMYWRKRWENDLSQPVQQWVIPRSQQRLLHEIAILSEYLEI